MSAPLRLAAAAIFGAVLLGGGMLLLQSPSPPSVGVDPSASPSASPSATPAPPSAAASDVAALGVPGEFTACLPDNANLRAGTRETVVVPHPDGDMTLDRNRGETWSGAITATDERFSGTHYLGWDNNGYTLPSGVPGSGPNITAEGHRIENAQGAWQGWSIGAGMSDIPGPHTKKFGPVFLKGEGEYEGLSAILFREELPGCFFGWRGVIAEFPEPPVPYTGE
jgi:hypothetical protein